MSDSLVGHASIAHYHDSFSHGFIYDSVGGGISKPSGFSFASTFFGCVNHVVRAGSLPKMVWSYTSRVVALMANNVSRTYGAVVKDEANNMSADNAAFVVSPDSSISVSTAGPVPAALSLGYLAGKSISNGLVAIDRFKEVLFDEFWIHSKFNKVIFGHP